MASDKAGQPRSAEQTDAEQAVPARTAAPPGSMHGRASPLTGSIWRSSTCACIGAVAAALMFAPAVPWAACCEMQAAGRLAALPEPRCVLRRQRQRHTPRPRASPPGAAAAAGRPLAPLPAVGVAVEPRTASFVQQLEQPAPQSSDLASDPLLEVDVVGNARHLGVDMEWRLSLRTDGSFREELSSPQTSYSSGHDATPAGGSGADTSSNGHTSSSGSNGSSAHGGAEPSSSGGSGDGSGHGSLRSMQRSLAGYFSSRGVSWGSDDAGCPRRMQLDDEEALLLSTWIRSGLWVLPRVAAQLRVRLAPGPRARHASAPAPAQHAAEAGGRGEGQPSPPQQQQQQTEGGEGGPSTWVEMRLRGGGRVTALVELCSASGRPLSAQLHLAGEHELWTFQDWREWQPGLWLAAAAEQCSSSQGSPANQYTLQTLEVRPASHAGNSSSSGGSGRFAAPPSPLLPADSAFLPGLPESVPAWHTISGHCLVKPELDGRSLGYWILDTGASGFVIDPRAADSLGLEAFGELQVTSMVGKITSRYRRARSFQLGPLRMERPLFMELPCSGIVSGVPEGGRVAGIVGYDVLRRAVVHMPPHPRRPLLPPSATAGIDSPAAAIAASASTAQMRTGALPFTLRLQHPGALDAAAGQGEGAAAAKGARGSEASSSSSSGGASGSCLNGGSDSSSSGSSSGSSSSGSSSAAPHGHGLPSGAAAAAAVGTPAAAESLGRGPVQQMQAAAAPALEVSSSSSGRNSSLSQHCQQQAVPPPDSRLQQHLEWLPLVMVSSLPHVELELVTAEGRRHTGLFMMDSGAGGFDLIISARAAQSMHLGARAAAGGGVTQIKGVGSGSQDRITARHCQLAEVRLGSLSFKAVQALYHGPPAASSSPNGGGNGAGLELSQYTSGIVCAGLLGRCGILLDYARGRVAFAGPPGAAGA